jgi:hypothetical protein
MLKNLGKELRKMPANSMDKSISCKPTVTQDSKKIFHLSWNTNVHKIPQAIPILNQMHTVHADTLFL